MPALVSRSPRISIFSGAAAGASSSTASSRTGFRVGESSTPSRSTEDALLRLVAPATSCAVLKFSCGGATVTVDDRRALTGVFESGFCRARRALPSA